MSLSAETLNPTHSTCRAFLHIQHGRLEPALTIIERAQLQVHGELRVRTGYTDFANRDYSSAIKILTRSQVLSEMKEVVRCECLLREAGPSTEPAQTSSLVNVRISRSIFATPGKAGSGSRIRT